MMFTEFDSATGRMGGVHSGYETSAEALTQVFFADMDSVTEGRHDHQTHYVSSGTVTARPTSPITLDGTTLLNVPAGAVIDLGGDQTVIEEADDVSLSFPLSGTYEVRVKHFPYLDFVAEVTV